MASKKPESKDSRDECVRKIADELKKDSWEVKADLEGFDRPDSVGGLPPAIEAKKGCLRRICEVATEDMFEGDKTRYIELRNYCDEYDFHFYVVDKKGKYKEIDADSVGKKEQKK
ncbi:MAG: hypothetical protein NWF04_04630 [Candidatus Bathyarchaeota archaeon]|nr:hypothetical protein [Candidatus Bathyarchaeota archaeon]